MGSRSSLASSAVTGGTTDVGSVPVRCIRINLFPRSDWVRVIREQGEDVRRILCGIDDDGVELGGCLEDETENEEVDADKGSCKEATNSERMKCNRAIVKDKNFKRGANGRGDKCDEDNSSMSKDKFKRGCASTDWGHYARG